MFLLLLAVLTVITLICFIPPIQELINYLKAAGIHISVDNFDVGYGISMPVP